MKKTLVAACSLLALCASVASAAPGIDLAWNDCGAAGTTSQTWTCDTNTGIPFTLFASFIPPAGINQFVGISSQMDFRSSSTRYFIRGPLVLAAGAWKGPTTVASCHSVYYGEPVSGYEAVARGSQHAHRIRQ